MICTTPDCDNYTEGTTDFCGSCNHTRRKAERLALKEKPKPKAIPKVSAKRKEKLKEYKILRQNYIFAHPKCQIKIMGICTFTSLEIHHCSMSDNDFLNTSTWKASCPECHRHTETILSAADRKEKGLLL